MSYEIIRKASPIRSWIERWLARKFIVRSGPIMYYCRGGWRYVSFYGDSYLIRPSGYDGRPEVVSEGKR